MLLSLLFSLSYRRFVLLRVSFFYLLLLCFHFICDSFSSCSLIVYFSASFSLSTNAAFPYTFHYILLLLSTVINVILIKDRTW